MRAWLGLVLLLALPHAAAEPTTVRVFLGEATAWTALLQGLPCASAPLSLPGEVRIVLVDSPGGGFDLLGFDFDTGSNVRVPCVLTRAGCFGSGDAAAGWRGVCAEGLPYVTWRLTARPDGLFTFTSSAPLGPAGWSVAATVAERAVLPLPV